MTDARRLDYYARVLKQQLFAVISVKTEPLMQTHNPKPYLEKRMSVCPPPFISTDILE